MKPFDPRLLKAAGQTKYFLIASVLLAMVSMLGTVVAAYGLTQFVVRIFVEQEALRDVSGWLLLALAGGLVRALAIFLGEIAGFRTARGIKRQFRLQALEKLAESDSILDAGGQSQLLGPGLDALDPYFGKFLPQLVFAGIVTPIFIAIIWVQDLISAISILLTLPLIPVFMVLIGLVTKDVQEQQLKATLRLNGHFLAVLRGVTTLKIFDRVGAQLETLERVSTEQKKRTMKVLRLSFLSGFALELAASLSVALIAVQIGLRLVDGSMTLAVGLFVLLLAPEVYLPLRNVGAQFHNSTEGVTAISKLLELLELERQEKSPMVEVGNGVTVLLGPSGSGKTTALRSLVSPASCYMPQQPHLFAASIAQNVSGFGESDQQLIEKCLISVGLDPDQAQTRVAGTGGVSGGQAQRINLARALYRLWSLNLRLLVLDEPTSMLDEENQTRIASLLRGLADSGTTVVIATHQSKISSIADRIIEMEVTGVRPS